MKEEWKDIKGYENKYQVSNLGNVRSLNYNNTGKPKNLKQKLNKYNYLEVKLSKDNKTKDFMVERLVAQAFMPNSDETKVITHIDNNKINNEVSNLKWVSIQEAKYLAYKNGNRPGNSSYKEM